MFDPYHKWLGIPPKDQPPNHYRLLGIELFESDREVIDVAANKQMAYLQSCATGPHVALSQKLLNEVAAARLCLLDPWNKAVYDARLELKMRPVRPVGPQEPIPDDSRDFDFPEHEEPQPKKLSSLAPAIAIVMILMVSVTLLALAIKSSVWRHKPSGPENPRRSYVVETTPPPPSETSVLSDPSTPPSLPPQPVPTGTLVLEIDPPETDVLIDDKAYTPDTDDCTLKVTLKPGKHHLQVTKPGYDTFDELVTVETDKTTTIPVRLEPL